MTILLKDHGINDKNKEFSFINATMKSSTFKNRTENLGWRKGSVIEHGEITTYHKEFKNNQLEVFIKLDNMGVGIYDLDINLKDWFYVKLGSVVIGRDTFDEPEKDSDHRFIPFGEIPEIVYSEIIYKKIIYSCIHWDKAIANTRYNLYPFIGIGHLYRNNYPQTIEIKFENGEKVFISAMKILDNNKCIPFTNHLTIFFYKSTIKRSKDKKAPIMR